MASTNAEDSNTEHTRTQPDHGYLIATASKARMQELVDKVAPTLRATSAVSEERRRLAPEAMNANALLDAGIRRALVPAAYGGSELGPVYGVKLFEELAYVDSAAAREGAIRAAAAWMMSLLPPRAADDVLGDPHAVVSGSW